MSRTRLRYMLALSFALIAGGSLQAQPFSIGYGLSYQAMAVEGGASLLFQQGYSVDLALWLSLRGGWALGLGSDFASFSPSTLGADWSLARAYYASEASLYCAYTFDTAADMTIAGRLRGGIAYSRYTGTDTIFAYPLAAIACFVAPSQDGYESLAFGAEALCRFRKDARSWALAFYIEAMITPRKREEAGP